MAENFINIGGKLYNVFDETGRVVNSAQVQYKESSIENAVNSIESNLTILNSDRKIITEKVQLDLNNSATVVKGIYNVLTAMNAPGTETEGILLIEDFSNGTETLFREIWNTNEGYFYRFIKNTSSLSSIPWIHFKEIDTERLAAKEYVLSKLSEINGVKKYSSDEEMKNAIADGNCQLGDVLVCYSGSTDDYSEDYTLYTVVLDKNGEMFPKPSGGSGGGTIELPELTIEAVSLNGGPNLGKGATIECNKGDTIKISYLFYSSKNDDIISAVQYRLGAIKSGEVSKVYPNGTTYNWTFTVPEVSSGIYNLSLYGTVNKVQSKKEILTLQIGALSIASNFDENEVVKSNQNLEIPVTIDVANEELTIRSYVYFDEELIVNGDVVTKGPEKIIIPAAKMTDGIHDIRIYLKNKDKEGPDSNELTFTIVAAKQGIVYAIPGKTEYQIAEGERLNIALRTLQLDNEESKYPTTMKVYYIGGEKEEKIKEVRYNLNYGVNQIALNDLVFKNNDNPDTAEDAVQYSLYRADFEASSDDERAQNGSASVIVKILKNNYSISAVDDGLLCYFDASGKSNLTEDYNTWEDKSGKNVKATLNNFNWTTNGWKEIDDNGVSSTALVLNAGAYVELDIAPFEKEIDTNGITISIDFETENILDSTAKVASCLFESDGTDTVNYFLRDGFGDYIKNPLSNDISDDTEREYSNSTEENKVYLSKNNVLNYFRYAGGYCWVDGKTYPNEDWPVLGLKTKDNELPYITTESSLTSERSLNYARGDMNPSYNNPLDKEPAPYIDENGEKIEYSKYDAEKPIVLTKCTGSRDEKVTKQVGFYVDTENAVLSNTSSPANIDEKFHLNFSEKTRTKIDLIITRNTGSPYYFASMIGFTNGTLSLMKQITSLDSFVQDMGSGRKFKVYLGGKAEYAWQGEQWNTSIVDTGSSKIYSFKIYDHALSPDDILRNYAAGIPDPAKKKRVIDNNGILNKNALPDLPQITFVGHKEGTSESTINSFVMQLAKKSDKTVSELKAIKEPAYLQFTTNPLDDDAKWTITKVDENGSEYKEETIPIRLQFQGTSSMVYPIKNFKFKCYYNFYKDSKGKFKYEDDPNGKKIKFDLGNGIKEQTFCLKVDYMDSSHCNNTGSANFISDYNIYATGKTPASQLDDRIRTTIYGFPVLIYYKDDPTDDQPKFIGVGNLNLDKSCTTSFGLKDKVEDRDGVKHNFGCVPFIDDEHTKDILVKAEYQGDTSQLVKEETASFKMVDNFKVVKGHICTLNGETVAVEYNGKYYIVQKALSFDEDEEECTETETYEIMLKNPNTGNLVGSVTSKNTIRALDGTEVSYVQCSEYKANSGKDGAGGFGNYNIESVASDIELRQPDDGDIEEINYGDAGDKMVGYLKWINNYNKEHPENPRTIVSYKEFKNPFYYHIQRMIKWVCNSDKADFIENLDAHFNRNFLMDYYLTISILGGVDSLGKNLMVGTWGPENRLYETTETAVDSLKFEYNGKWLTPTVNKIFTGLDKDGKDVYEYKLAKNSDGLFLYYDPECFDRWAKAFKGNHKEFIVTTVPGECIWYPTFYDIDTICGLDNSGQLIYDVDIEIGDQLEDGTAIFNTADSNLWGRVKNFLGEEDAAGNSVLSERWSLLRSTKRIADADSDDTLFSEKNLINRFYNERQISRIPEKYYNLDCLIKYIYEGPNPPLNEDGTVNDEDRGSGSYLYCIHGSRYEQIKRWYSQRIYYLDSLYSRGFGTNNSSLRFNHSKFDANYRDDKDYYTDLPGLAASNPENYSYDAVNNVLKTASGAEILPITFNFKTYQPGYVGVKWFNGGKIHKTRVGRNGMSSLVGNVKSAGDTEVFIYGGSNIREIGDMYEFNVKQIDFKNLTKLSKLILGNENSSCVINKLDLGLNNTYLSELDLTNCTSLTSIDVSPCTNLRVVKMIGSGITSAALPSGGALETVKYSSSITAIKLEDFINLSTIEVPNLNNIVSLVIKNCPNILGKRNSDGSISQSAKGWALLQQTNNANSLNQIEIEAYGECSPRMLTNGKPFFFLDKFFEKATSKNIKGEIYYQGTTIPENYTRFDTAYPNLNITYSKITDVSEMFANYKNINLIKSLEVYTGDDIYGKPQYTSVRYWVDSSNTIYPDGRNAVQKWHNEEEIKRNYNYSSTYTGDIDYYYFGGTYYRLLKVYDDEDLDLLRNEIKQHIQNFTKFTSIKGMFKNISILDYLDPDTFNNIDLSTLDPDGADDVFLGCTNLRYFEMPSDIVKCQVRTRYENAAGAVITKESYETEELFNQAIASGEISLKEYLYDPVNNRETTESTVTAIRGLRRIGANMFNGCKKVRVFIKNLSNDDKITISDSAFVYDCYNPVNEAQSKSVTIERPVILFQRKAEDVLVTTDEASYDVVEGDITKTYYNEPIPGSSKFFKVLPEGQKEIDPNNLYYNMGYSWLREVYFGIEKIVIDDNNLYPLAENGYSLSYAEDYEGKRILFDAKPLGSNKGTTFNVFENEVDFVIEKYYNQLNLRSITCGALRNLPNLESLQILFPKYDNLDLERPIYDIECSLASIFGEGYFTFEKAQEAIPSALMTLYIMNTEVIESRSLSGFKNVKIIGLSKDTKIIKRAAFKGDTGLTNIFWGDKTYSDINCTITKIEDEAFSGCTSLGTIQLPNTLEDTFDEFGELKESALGRNVFEGCSSLTSVKYSENLTTVPEYTFANCTSLTYVSSFSDRITHFKDSCFYKCKSIVLLEKDTSRIIFNNNYNSADVGFSYFKNLKEIGANSFNNVSGIIPSSKNEEEEYGILKLEIPSTVRLIGVSAFEQERNAPVDAQFQTELVWKGETGNDDEDFKFLEIGARAFYNLRTAYTIKINDTDEFISDIVYVPNVLSIGENAFHAYNEANKFKFCLMRNQKDPIFADDGVSVLKDGIGEGWINLTGKIIYSYIGISDAQSSHDVYQGTNLRARYLLSSSISENKAYLYKAYATNQPIIYLPDKVSVGNKDFIIKEVLTNAFAEISNIQFLYFNKNSTIELFERNVLTNANSAGLVSIGLLEDGASEPELDMIPVTLTVSTGNNLKNNIWFATKSDTTFITLGRYLIGFNSKNFVVSNYTLDLSETGGFFNEIKLCDTIYDGAFQEDTRLKGIKFNDKIEHIYMNAFAKSGLDYSESDDFFLPRNIKTIKENAFSGCKFRKLRFPSSLQEIGAGAFKENDNATAAAGVLKHVEFGEDCALTGTPFNVQTELETGVKDPTLVNVTLDTLIVPPSMAWIMLPGSFSGLNLLSQVKNLCLGNMERDADGYCIKSKNIKLYLDENLTPTYEVTANPYQKEVDGETKQVYGYKYVYDMVKDLSQAYKNYIIETFEEESYCPLSDIKDADGNIIRKGFDANINISNIIEYPNPEFRVPVEGVSISNLTGPDLLRIVAGFTTQSSELRTITLRKSQQTMLLNYANIYAQTGRSFTWDAIVDVK